MSSYAAGTDISVARSVAELDALLAKYGATDFAYGRIGNVRMRVMFQIDNRMMRFDVAKPDAGEFRHTPSGRVRASTEVAKMCEAEERRRWRALVLVVKALLVAVTEPTPDVGLVNPVVHDPVNHPRHYTSHPVGRRMHRRDPAYEFQPRQRYEIPLACRRERRTDRGPAQSGLVHPRRDRLP